MTDKQIPDQAAQLAWLLQRAQEELRMIRMKDSDAIYDALIRIEIDAALESYKASRLGSPMGVSDDR